ncbi:MAG: hypothetical protein ACE5G5_02840 [Candidatus Methylomirabilales bacterium]
MLPWTTSPTLQKIYQGLEEQQRIIEQLKVYIEERLAPFHRHIGEHRRHIDQALRNLEGRLKPLRQYIQGEHQNLNRVTVYLESDLRSQFEAFDHFLTRQKGLLEEASQYIEEQPRPFQTYLEDERHAVAMIHQNLEERMDRFLQNLAEQQKLLESLREPEANSEYNALAEYLEERLKVLERHVRLPDSRPAELFAQLEETADRHKRLHLENNRLFARVFEETRLADQKLRQALAAKST